MGEIHGLTAEQYQAIVAIVDDRLEAGRVTREGFERLETAIVRLTEAQARTEERVGQVEVRVGRLEEAMVRLTEAQAHTEIRVGRLEEAIVRLTEAQARTEAALQQLARQVGDLSDTVGGDIEDIAYIVLHDVLQRDFGWQVGVLERTWQQWNGEPEEISVFGQATDSTHPERTIWIVGEAKHNLTLREVERFVRQVERARRHLAGEVYVVCFATGHDQRCGHGCGSWGFRCSFPTAALPKKGVLCVINERQA